MKLLSKSLLAVGALALAASPATLTAGTAGAQAVEPIEVQFTTVGSSDFTVPDGVHCVAYDAIGAIGAVGGSSGSGTGGLGGEVQGTLEVLPGQALQVNVGGGGGAASGATGGAGGVNGGGAGGTTTEVGGGGGGGASDIRQGGTSLADRAAVAAGGGGAGAFGTVNGGEGGNPGGDGGTYSPAPSEPGGGGATGTTPGPGAPSASAPGTADGQSGVLGAGGAGGGGTTLSINGGGGGGGGGYYGGGGGAGVISGSGPAGGGGGGANFVVGEGMTGNTGVGAGNGSDGRVTLSYVPGDTDCVQAPLTITKTLGGAPLPAAGTQFTVDVRCDESTIDLGSLGQVGTSDDATLEFTVGSDGAVAPVGPDTISFVGPTACTVTEPGSGTAASTTFTCAGTAGSAIGGGSAPARAGSWGPSGSAAVTPDSPMCPAPGPSADSIVVNIVFPDQHAEIGVLNTFVATAAVIAPRFTG